MIQRSLMGVVLWLLASNAAPLAAATESKAVIVKIQQGRLRGVDESGVQIFKGIPYAAAPIGALRWRPPQPAPSWRGVRDASRFGPICPQVIPPNEKDVRGQPMAEDCLHLTVWTQGTQRKARRPVMLWLLPGGFRGGDVSMARYDGAALARRGVVVVSFNYRLGLLGEFAHPALIRAQANEPLGNYNLMDQIAAMRWVRANIDRFGGDPHNVTIFGMSAGGMSVNYHMASPASAGLFDKAISQSSALRISFDRRLREDVHDLQSLEAESLRHAEALGIRGDDAAVISQLRALPLEQLFAYQRTHRIGTSGGMSPVIDGRILTMSVGQAFREGRAAKVPYMTGATSWEGSLAKGGASTLKPVLELLAMTREQVETPYRGVGEETLGATLYTDFFLATQRYFAQTQAQHGQRAWVYRFSRLLDAHRNDYPGAAHGAETRYVLGTLDALAQVASVEHPGDMGWQVSDSDRAYADIVARYWVNFATTGDPNKSANGSSDLPDWPAVTQSDEPLLEFTQQGPVAQKNFLPERTALFKAQFTSGKL